MDIAYCENLDEIVCGIELTEMDVNEIKSLSFFCPECYVSQLPASYDPSNKKIPYFRTFPSGDDHDLDCDYHKNNKNKRNKKLTNTDGDQEFPFRVPNKLILVSPRHLKKNIDTPLKKRVKIIQRMYSTSSLRPICQTYLSYPEHRATLSLSIPNISGETYIECFRTLRKGNDNSVDKVLYDLIKWNNLRDGILKNYESNLNEIRNKLVFNTFNSGKIIKVNCDSWTDKQLTSLLWEIDDAIEHVIADFIKYKQLWKEANPDKNIKNLPQFTNPKKVRLFFIGKKDESNEDVFIVDNRRLITVFYH